MFIFSRSLVTKAIMVAMLLMAMLAFFTPRLQAETLPDNFKLICDFSKFRNTGYSTDFAKSWIAEKQFHYFSGTQVKDRFSSFSIHKNSGRVTEHTSKKIKWVYEGHAETIKGNMVKYKQFYAYHLTTGKVATKIHFPRYIDVEYVWGECKQDVKRVSASPARQNSELNKASQGLIPIRLKNWELIRGNSLSELYRSKRGNAIYFRSSNSYFIELHEKLMNRPDLDVRFDIHLSTKMEKLRKFHFKSKRPDFIAAIMHKGYRTLVIADESLEFATKTQHRILTLFATDHESGLWFYESLENE